MGKYVADRIFIEGNEKRIREVLSDYNENIHQFETKDIKVAGKRARKNLLELYHLCRVRRQEILDRGKTLNWVEHPSWSEIEDERV